MECTISSFNIPTCVCQRECILYNKKKRRHICGSNGKLYVNFCEIYRDSCLTGEPIKITDMSKCIHHEPSCSSDEFAIMKDNLLLFHFRNMGSLQHGPDEVHRLDYLVSIIFSHYDSNNDGLVEKDELDLIWNTLDMHHVANDSNCTLRDLLVYDDFNGDDVITINEFNDAFRRISDTHEVKTENVPLERVIPKIHLDISLATNHVNIDCFSNIEIKCDITGVSPPTFIWKRFGFDLSQMRNDTDDYEDEDNEKSTEELKLMADGGLFIQNVQMKHAGNYSCQASSNGMIVQTHIVKVHAQPVILVSPQMQSKRPGESAEIYCHSLGEFASSLGWLKNEKPLDQNDEKYTIIGNGTLLRINNLTSFDTSTYTCTSINGHSSASTLIIQNEPNAIAVNRDQKVFVFHSNGISIYSSGLCQLVHEIRASDFVPGTDDSICHQYARRCTWGQSVVLDGPDGLIYITQPMMNRLLVLSIAQLIIIEVIPSKFR
jgi:follistatin-related protein 5